MERESELTFIERKKDFLLLLELPVIRLLELLKEQFDVMFFKTILSVDTV